jgi:flagellar biosynthesis/type III secretory pathway protein FliH
MELNLRNFDAEFEPISLTGGGSDKERPTRMFTEAEFETLMRDTREAALAEGRAVGAAKAKAELEETATAKAAQVADEISQALSELALRDSRQRQDMEKDIVDLLLGASERILPEFLSTFGADLVTEKVRSGLRLAASSTSLSIHVSPKIEPLIRDRMPEWTQHGLEDLEVRIIADPHLSDTATRLDWQNGHLNYDLDRVCNDVLSLLRETAQSLNGQLKKAE